MIGPAVFALLDNDPDTKAITEGRWTPGIIPQNQPVPCGFYGTDRIKFLPVRNHMGCFSGTLEIWFQVAEGDYDVLEALTTAINTVLENYTGTIAGISLTISTGQTTPDDFDPDLRYHTRAIEYSITGQLTQ